MPVRGCVPIAVRRKHQKNACEKCGAVSRLGLHHIDNDRTNNSPENLLTLCPSCHTSWHWANGKTPWRRHPSTCGVCGKRAARRGLCNTHLIRWKRHGSPYHKKRKIGSRWTLVDVRTGERVSG